MTKPTQPQRTRENLEGLPVELTDGLRRHLPPSCAECSDTRDAHPDGGMVRFEWATTARPDGFWYYRFGRTLIGPSVLRRDHPFVSQA